MRPWLALPAIFLSALVGAACIDEPAPAVAPPPPVLERKDEGHLTRVRQLTFGGDSARGRWAWDGGQIVLQTRAVHGCARIARVSLADPPALSAVAEGEGPAFLPGNRQIVYSSASPCPSRSGQGDGIVLDAHLDVFRAELDGSEPTPLTHAPGYDAEASVCGKDGSIVFTSMRDGDPDLYRMDADGGGVQRLTATAGYDGGAVFDTDCTHVAWQASRPKGVDLDDYKKQLVTGLLRPRTLELWIANADGTDARQITYLEARSSAPTWFPGQERILFQSTYGATAARDSDLWAIDLDGTNLERVTTAPGLDGSPAFSPDGKWLAFASGRATPLEPNAEETIVARWTGAWRHVDERAADHLMGDVAWLADRAREGRGLGSHGLADAGAYVERSLRSFGLVAAGNDEMRQTFDVKARPSAVATLDVAGVPAAAAPESTSAFNVVARWAASAPPDQRLPGVIVIGAHYDGLGEASPGADDNASGTAALLHVARSLAEEQPSLRRDIVFVAFSGEPQGAAGARAFVKNPPGGLAAKDFIAMIDLDIVGRMRDGSLQVFGVDSAAQWPDLLAGACDAAHVDCVRATGGGLGGADQTPFFEAGVPVLQLFTGVHSDLHKPTDTANKLNATGMAQVARIAESLARDLSDLSGRPDFQQNAAPPGEGDARRYGASLGTIPDRAGPPKGQKGMLLAGVRARGPADRAGLRAGDIVVRLGGHVVGTVEDVMFVLTEAKPGALMPLVVLRDGKEIAVDVTLEAPNKR